MWRAKCVSDLEYACSLWFLRLLGTVLENYMREGSWTSICTRHDSCQQCVIDGMIFFTTVKDKSLKWLRNVCPTLAMVSHGSATL